MSDSIEVLKDKRAELYDQMRKLNDSVGTTRTMTAVEQRDWDKLEKQSDELDRQIRLEQSQTVRAIVNGNTDVSHASRPVDGQVRMLNASQKFSRQGYELPSGVQPQDVSAGRYLRALITSNWRGAEAEEALFYAKRSEGGGVGSLGGYLLPQVLSDQVIDLARARMTVVQAGAQTFEMETEQVRIAKVSGDATATWRPENTTINPSTVLFQQIQLRARTLAAYFTASRELIQDAANANSVLEETLAKAMAVEWDRAALLGNGAGETPFGLRYQTSVGLTTALAAATTTYLPVLRQLRDIYNANYPGTPDGLSIIWSPRTSFTYTSIQDGQQQPLRMPPSIESIPRYVTSQVAVNDTTTFGSTEAYPQFMGDFSKLLLGMRWPIEVQLSLEAGSVFQSNQVAIRAVQRGDIAVTQPTFFAVITGSTA